jgi:uncharacterized membrane protein
MEIPLKARVECADGACGESAAVIVNPLTHQLTHLVVHDKEMHHPNQRLVPIEHVVQTTHDRVRLNCSREDVRRMPPFVVTRYIPKEQPDYSMYQGGEYYEPYASTVGADYDRHDEELVPLGERAVHRGARVEASDGHIGTVAELVVDESSEYITHFVLEEGHLWGKKEITLPLSAVDHVEGDTVYLKLDKQAIAQLPTIPLRRGHLGLETEVELVAHVFKAPDEDNERLAREALEYVEKLHRQQVFKILNAAVIAKDSEGNVSATDTRDIDPKKGRVMGAITGGLIGLLAGPGGVILGALAGTGAGAAAGKWIDLGFSEKFLKNLQDHLEPGSAALILLVEHEWVKSVAESLADREGFVFQQPLTDRLVEELIGNSTPEE